VEVEGVISDRDGNQVWMQTAEGGPYSGIYLYAGPTGAKIDATFPGAKVVVCGTYVEYQGLSEITLLTPLEAEVHALEAGPIPELTLLSAYSLSGQEVAEKWEGVTVRVGSQLDLLSLGPNTLADASSRAFLFSGSVYSIGLDPLGEVLFPELGPGASFRAVSGIVHFTGNQFFLYPREASDYEGYVPPSQAQPGVLRIGNTLSEGGAIDLWISLSGADEWQKIGDTISPQTLSAEVTLAPGLYDVRIGPPGFSVDVGATASATSVEIVSGEYHGWFGVGEGALTTLITLASGAVITEDDEAAMIFVNGLADATIVDAGFADDKSWLAVTPFATGGAVEVSVSTPPTFALYPEGQSTVLGRYTLPPLFEGARTTLVAYEAPDQMIRVIAYDDLGNAATLDPS
jgi:hypothetical protein